MTPFGIDGWTINDGGRGKTEDRDQMTDDGGQRTEDRGQMTEGGGRMLNLRLFKYLRMSADSS